MAPLDKGLSGSSVWLARWQLLTGNPSKLHVFKIGEKRKLDREHNAIATIASVIEPDFPHVAYFSDGPSGKALLRQQFVGDAAGDAKNLRQHLATCEPADSRAMIHRLFGERMKYWHPDTVDYPTRELALSDALDWWWTKCNIDAAATQTGRRGLEDSLKSLLSTDLANVTRQVSEVAAQRLTVAIGPVHGDLHAENVLVGDGGQLELIDYGWTNQEKWKAIDFLMMECSLKFVCSPAHAALNDLLRMEKLLDERIDVPDAGYDELLEAMYGTSLATIATAVHVTRRAAIDLKAVVDFDQYRKGLVILTACLASLPSPINRAFIFHSIAHHLSKA